MSALEREPAFDTLSKRLADRPKLASTRVCGGLGSVVEDHMSESESLVHSRNIPREQAGELLNLPRQEAQRIDGNVVLLGDHL